MASEKTARVVPPWLKRGRVPAMFVRDGGRRYGSELPLPPSDGHARPRRTIYGATEAELASNWNDAVAAVVRGLEPLDRRLPLAVVIERYLDAREPECTADGEAEIRDSTWRGYEGHGRLHIVPFLGRIPVSELTTRRVKLWLGELRDGGRSTAMRGKVLVSLRTILDWAIGEGYIDTNPAKGAKPPRHRARPVAPFSMREIAAMIDAIRGHRLEAQWLIALTLGPRLGELNGLLEADVDEERRTVCLGHTLSWTTGHPVRQEDPKTPASARTLRLPDSVWEALVAYRAAKAGERAAALAAGRRWEDSGYLFTTKHGTPLRGDGDGGVGSQFQGCLRRAGLATRNFHQTRHIAASILLSLNGNNLHEVQQILGHSTYRMTLDLYSHLVAEVQEQRAVDLDGLLRTLEADRVAREARRNARLDEHAAPDEIDLEVLSEVLSNEPDDDAA